MPRGGFRPRAGRPKGTGPYGEATIPVRIPISRLESLKHWLNGETFEAGFEAGWEEGQQDMKSRAIAACPEHGDKIASLHIADY